MPGVRIAIFDYRVTKTNPVGSCHLRLIQSLCHEHDITVFAPEFENPAPDRITHVRVRVPLRPLVLLYFAFHLAAPSYFWWHRFRTGKRFDLVQMVESNTLTRRDIAYVHFCHRRFLTAYWPIVKGRGLRSILRFWDHKLHALMEPIVFRKAGRIVVPSKGLGRELAAEYPSIASKIQVIHNPIDLTAFARPPEFDVVSTRAGLKIDPDDVVMIFVALGHFERKGLPLVLQAMAAMKRPELKLLIVGGEPGLIASYDERARQMGLQGKVCFAGVQRDVRPYFWSSDCFILPSSYETFSLVAFQAAAAGLPVIVSQLNGVEEFAVDGVNSIIIQCNADAVRSGIERFLAMPAQDRQQMGQRARNEVSPFSADRFDASWRALYASFEATLPS